MKKYLFIIIAVLLVALFCVCLRSCKQSNTINRLQYNQKALSDKIGEYKTESDLSAYYVKQLTMTKQELKDNNAKLCAQLADANIKIRDLQNATSIAQTSNYSFVPETIMRIDTITLQRKAILTYSDKWIDFEFDSIANITTRDSIIVMNHCKTKKFLWWTWKRYSGQTTIVNANPYSRTQEITTIDIEK